MEVKRKAGDYEITQALFIGSKEIVLGENLADTDGNPYMCAFCESNDFIERYFDIFAGSNYAEIVAEYGKRIKEQAEKTRSELAQERVSSEGGKILREDNCTPVSYDDDLNNKVVVIKADILRPEYRSARYQLRLCTGGFGASPHSRGSACYCKDLVTGRESRFERRDILGVMEQDKLPDWAKEGLERFKQAEKKLASRGKEER